LKIFSHIFCKASENKKNINCVLNRTVQLCRNYLIIYKFTFLKDVDFIIYFGTFNGVKDDNFNDVITKENSNALLVEARLLFKNKVLLRTLAGLWPGLT